MMLLLCSCWSLLCPCYDTSRGIACCQNAFDQGLSPQLPLLIWAGLTGASHTHETVFLPDRKKLFDFKSIFLNTSWSFQIIFTSKFTPLKVNVKYGIMQVDSFQLKFMVYGLFIKIGVLLKNV